MTLGHLAFVAAFAPWCCCADETEYLAGGAAASGISSLIDDLGSIEPKKREAAFLALKKDRKSYPDLIRARGDRNLERQKRIELLLDFHRQSRLARFEESKGDLPIDLVIELLGTRPGINKDEWLFLYDRVAGTDKELGAGFSVREAFFGRKHLLTFNSKTGDEVGATVFVSDRVFAGKIVARETAARSFLVSKRDVLVGKTVSGCSAILHGSLRPRNDDDKLTASGSRIFCARGLVCHSLFGCLVVSNGDVEVSGNALGCTFVLFGGKLTIGAKKDADDNKILDYSKGDKLPKTVSLFKLARLGATTGVTEEGGVLVKSVEKASLFGLGGLRAGDLVRKANGLQIENVAQLESICRAVYAQGEELVLSVTRGSKEVELRVVLFD